MQVKQYGVATIRTLHSNDDNAKMIQNGTYAVNPRPLATLNHLVNIVITMLENDGLDTIWNSVDEGMFCKTT